VRLPAQSGTRAPHGVTGDYQHSTLFQIEKYKMAQQAEGQKELLNYVNTQTHKSNLRNALDYHSVREPDLELISTEGRRLYGHRSVLGIFSPMLVDIFSYTPCCQKASIVFPDTTSEVLSHLLNVLYTGSTEATNDKVEILCGVNGVFATAKLMGIDIKTDQKVIEVIEKKENIVDSPYSNFASSFRRDIIEPSAHEIDVEEGEDSIIVEGDEEPETMEICPQIPMFDLGSLLYQEHQDPNDYLAEEEPIPAPIPVENEDYYICKLPSCQTIIQFENCGARSKILNHYTSHFQRELEQSYGHLITEEQQCTLCKKDLRNFIKSKIWIHIGVTHDKTNEILTKRGIDPISTNIRMKRKASDAFREEVSPRFDESHPGLDYQMMSTTPKTNTCKLCGQVTQNRKRLLKHYCTKHYIDRLGMMEFDFIDKNKCVHCDKDFIGAKKSSKVIHIGLEHKKIFEILEEEFGKDGYLKHDSMTPAMPPLKKIKTSDIIIQPQTPKIDFSNPHTPSKVEYVTPILSFHNTPRTELSMSDKMKEIQELGNKCFVCDKKFDLFRSMLLPHYCGHFYKEIAQGHEDYFTMENCKLCGAKATKRKSRIIHLGVKHELVLPYIEEVLRNRDIPALTDEGINYEVLEENHVEYEDEVQVKQEPQTNNEVVDEIVLNNDIHASIGEVKEESIEPKVVTPIRIKTINLKNLKGKEAADHDEGIIIKKEAGAEEVLNIKRIKTEDEHEDRKTPTQVLMKNQNKEVWITPSKSKEEVFVKRSNQYRNLENQEKTYHLDKLFNENDVVDDELNDECYNEEVTMDNLGLVCKICNTTEATDHELLTHYCSHFNSELKNIAEKMIDEEHKCVECHKMLGNNKRRLYHFGVKHLKVIPMINRKLKSQTNSVSTSNNVHRPNKKPVEEEISEDFTEEDEFEITYDQPVKIVEEHSAYKDALQTTVKNVKKSELKPKHSNPRVCELCGCKRNTNSNLLLHYTKQHFIKDIKDRFGGYIVDNRCTLCDDMIDVTMKNVGEAEKWIHLGHKHGKTNEILHEMGKTQIIIKDKKDVSYIQTAEPVIETKILESVSNSEVFQSSEDEISSSPPQPEPEVFSCQLCDKTTKNQTLLDLHLIAIHFKKEILHNYGNAENTCELCTKAFPNADGFAFHLGQDHDLLRLIMQRRAKMMAEKAETQGQSRIPNVKQITPKAPEVKNPTEKPQEVPSFPCFKCGARRRSKKELYGHYSLQHFSKELMEEFGVQKKCSIEDCGRILENGTSWISHLGQEHPSTVDKYIPQKFWMTEDGARAEAKERPRAVLKCPLKCSTPFTEQSELLTHFRDVHGFNNEIIKKVLKAHPQLNALSEEKYVKGIEA